MILAQLLFWHKNYVMGLKVYESADTLRNSKTLWSTTAYFVVLQRRVSWTPFITKKIRVITYNVT